MSLTSFKVSYSNMSFIFSPSILIFSSLIITPKNPTSLTFYLHFSSFTYKSFSANLFTTSSTTSLYPFSSSVPTITSLMKLAISPVLIKFQRFSFIVARKFVSLKNITISSNNSSGIVNTIFYPFLSFIHILSYSHHRSNLVNTFFVSIFSTMSEIKGKG